MRPRTDKQWRDWEKKVRQGQLEAQKRAYRKLGKGRRPNHNPVIPKPKGAKRKGQRGPSGERAARGSPNTNGFICPVCFAQPETVRNDGVSTARHLPIRDGVDLYRDTEFCNGQGKMSLFVLDSDWKPGQKPEKTITARKYMKGGVVD